MNDFYQVHFRKSVYCNTVYRMICQIAGTARGRVSVISTSALVGLAVEQPLCTVKYAGSFVPRIVCTICERC